VADEEHPLDRRICVERSRDRVDVERLVLGTANDGDVEAVLLRLIDDAIAEEAVGREQALAERLHREQTRFVGARARRGQDRREVAIRMLDPDQLLQVAFRIREHAGERVLSMVVARRVRKVLRDQRRDPDWSRREQNQVAHLLVPDDVNVSVYHCFKSRNQDYVQR